MSIWRHSGEADTTCGFAGALRVATAGEGEANPVPARWPVRLIPTGP